MRTLLEASHFLCHLKDAELVMAGVPEVGKHLGDTDCLRGGAYMGYKGVGRDICELVAKIWPSSTLHLKRRLRCRCDANVNANVKFHQEVHRMITHQ